MESVFEMVIHGNSDVNVDGVMFEYADFYFRSFNTKKMIEILDRLNIGSLSSKIAHKRKASDLRTAVLDMKRFLEHAEEKTFTLQEFGGNQFVRVERIVIPTEEDFED